MRALLCKAFGPPETLVVEDLPSPTPGADEVVVTVKVAGVNFPDTLTIQNKYQFKPKLPFSPGQDIAGVIKEAGPGVSGFKVGDRVIANLTHGGFREEVAVQTSRLVPMPGGLDYENAASFCLPYTTSYHALKDCANLQQGESLLVLGASGGAGLAAVELGKLMGARVIACASTAEKLEVCRRYGADEVINYETEDMRGRMKELVGEKGVDVTYDPVGGKYSEPALRSMARKGRYLVVGFAAGPIPSFALNLILLKCCAVIGVRRGEFRLYEREVYDSNMRQLMDWIVAEKLRPLISARYSLERGAEAINALMTRQVMGKVVIVM